MSEFFESLKFIESEWSVVIRMVLAVICGGLIGLEREHKHRVAGFRTHILVCIGATLTTLTSQYLWTFYNPNWIYAAENVKNMIPDGLWTLDPARLGAQVIAGIGFIGAGTILVTKRRQVKGLTTAAGLWTTAIVGLALGVGFYGGALYVTFLILLVEILFSKLEFSAAAKARDLTVYVEFGEGQCIARIIDELRVSQVRVLDVELSKTLSQNDEPLMCAILTVRFDKSVKREDALLKLSALDDVKTVHEL